MSGSPDGDHSGALAVFGVQAGTHAGEEIPIRSPVARIGKGSQNEIVIPDDSVSTIHAQLEFGEGGWRLTDLGSTNGTYVEGVRLAPDVPTPLPYTSVVRFGGVGFHFRDVEAADPQAARARYTPPPETTRLADQRSGFRLPVWVIFMVLLLIALAIFFLGWVWTPTPSPAPTTALLLPAAVPGGS
jgi:pSer/pThr/pTyr-binding forkhead associated (FHA) protein